MNTIIATTAALLVTLAPTPSQPAQDADEQALVTANKGGDVQREYIFGDEEIDGDLLNPDGVVINKAQGIRWGSLITLRGTFTPELIKLAQDI
ncbi:MAG: hypothetical protein KC636_03215 [Myxococcales bacterium]|nr:hypothetical protein [Myxococcales bacterium]